MQYPASRITGGSIQKKNIAADRGESSVMSKRKRMSPTTIPATISQHDSGTMNARLGRKVMPATHNSMLVNKWGNSTRIYYFTKFGYTGHENPRCNDEWDFNSW